MITDNVNYVEKVPDGGYRIAGSRVGLESVVLAYLDGQSPESIQDNFPSLTLEAILDDTDRPQLDRFRGRILARQTIPLIFSTARWRANFYRSRP